MDIRNLVFGRIFGYRGWFNLEWIPCPADAFPADARPIRDERRE